MEKKIYKKVTELVLLESSLLSHNLSDRKSKAAYPSFLLKEQIQYKQLILTI